MQSGFMCDVAELTCMLYNYGACNIFRLTEWGLMKKSP